MSKLFFLFRFLIWSGVIIFFIYFPGDVRIQWINYDIQTSIFFLFAVLFIVDKFMTIFGKLGRFLFHDFGRNIALSHYKSEVKNLKKENKKQLEKTHKKEKEEAKKRWSFRWKKIKKVFKKK